MRWLVIAFLVLFAAAGVVFGALNAGLVGYDLGFARVSFPAGAALLAGVAVGWLLGGVTAWIGVSSRHRRVRKQDHQADKKSSARS